MDAKGKKYKSALEQLQSGREVTNGVEDDWVDNGEEMDLSDRDEEDDGEGHVESDKYLTPSEVRAQLKLLWQKNAQILDVIWRRAIPDSRENNGYERFNIFFLQAVLVTPTRFRPRSAIGEAASEHPQNVHLSSIISANESIVKVLTEAQERATAEGGENGEVDKAVVLSKQISAWISLQNAVNCYMDSSKDPNPLGSPGSTDLTSPLHYFYSYPQYSITKQALSLFSLQVSLPRTFPSLSFPSLLDECLAMMIYVLFTDLF